MESWERVNCQCEIHRYHVAHICACGTIYAHSQSSCDAHRTHNGCLDIDPLTVNCEMRDFRQQAQDLFDKIVIMGTAQSQKDFAEVYHAFAEMERPQPHLVKHA